MPVKRSWLRAATGTVTGGVLLTAGLAACTPSTATATALKCTALATPASPTQNAIATITVKSAAGVTVVTTAAYRAATEKQISFTNASGVASVKYRVGAAEVGYPVKVTVKLSKGVQKGSCAASFTPAAIVVKPPKPSPLSATITPRWENVSSGMSLAGSPATCLDIHVRTGGGCGTFAVSALITGFSSYGGIPACPASHNGCYFDPGPLLTGQVSFSWKVSCDSTGVVSEHDGQILALGPEWNGHNAVVNSFTRVTDDSAQLEIALDMPFQADVNNCSGSSTLVSVTASDIMLHLPSGGTLPAADFTSAGPFSN